MSQIRLLPLMVTVITGVIGGTLAVWVHAPIPWLLGSLLLTALATLFGVRLKRLPGSLEKWMRVIVGVALGYSVASSLGDFGSATLLTMVASVATVLLLAYIGYVFFQRWLSMSAGEAYLSALPGGLSFMMALADSLIHMQILRAAPGSH